MKAMRSDIVDRFDHPEIDALRAIGFVMLFLYGALPPDAEFYQAHHISALYAKILSASVFSLGFGLSFLFFLSAFLCARIALIEKATIGAFDLKGFYLRRALRIFPLYFLAVAIGALVAIFTQQPHIIENILPFLGFYENIRVSNEGWSVPPMSALWSISIMVQFYAVFPFIMTFSHKMTLRYISFGLMLSSIVALAVQGEQHLELHRVIWCSSLSQLFFCGVGMFIATLPLERIALDPLRRVLTSIYALVLFPASCFFFDAVSFSNANSGSSLAAGYALAGVACISLFISFWGLQAAVPAWLRYLGKIVYGLYVYQAVMMFVLDAVWRTGWLAKPLPQLLALPLVILVASLSYRFYETPFLKLSRHVSRLQPRKS